MTTSFWCLKMSKKKDEDDDMLNIQFPPEIPRGWDLDFVVDDIPEDLPEFYETWYDYIDEIYETVVTAPRELDQYEAALVLEGKIGTDQVAVGVPFQSGKHWVLRVRSK